MKTYRAILSSDWNQCLAPCGPFDCIAFNYPHLAAELDAVFRQYTGNRITLGCAVDRIHSLLPAPLSAGQMDAYLKATFAAYTGVADLVEWCAANRVLFMINTTGAIGYFQRAFALGLLPSVPVLSAHPMIRYPFGSKDPGHIYELLETTDKGRHTAAVAKRYAISAERVIVIGDSAGDGPHFSWAAGAGALKIGSMTKPSLTDYCQERQIGIDIHFGLRYESGEKRRPEEEMKFNFRELVPMIETVMAD